MSSRDGHIDVYLKEISMSEIHRIDSPEGRRYLYFSTIDNTYLGSPMSRFELLELLKSGEYE